jgi:peroxiredoxin
MAHVLDGITVFDPDGREIRLGELWANRTAVLVFVRHFGCLFCRQQIAAIGLLRERVRSLGAELAVIGHGSLEQTRAFRDEQAAPLPLFTDPTRKAYCALGMRRDPRSVLTLRVLARSVKASPAIPSSREASWSSRPRAWSAIGSSAAKRASTHRRPRSSRRLRI